MSQGDLDIAVKTRSNPLAWNGQFSPQLVHSLIGAYAPREGSLILDPFAGSATVAGETIVLGHSFVGFEVNPAAYILGSLYGLATLEGGRRSAALNDARKRVGLLFERFAAPRGTLEVETVAAVEWTGTRSANVVIATLLLSMFRSGRTASAQHFARVHERLSQLVMSWPLVSGQASLRLGDARATRLADQAVDLVVTSPPYINVFNYHQQYRPVVEALGCRPLFAAAAEVGANRKHRQNRYLTVIQYCIDIALALAEMIRVSKDGGRVIMVVGRESAVLGVAFMNGELVAQVAKRCLGIDILLRQERKFLNRYGQVIYEDLLHFVRSDDVPASNIESAARSVGVEALHAALAFAPAKAREYLRSACLHAAQVTASPSLATDRLAIPAPLCPKAAAESQ